MGLANCISDLNSVNPSHIIYNSGVAGGCFLVGGIVAFTVNEIGLSILDCKKDSYQSIGVRLTSTIAGTAAGFFTSSLIPPIQSFTVSIALTMLATVGVIHLIGAAVFSSDEKRANACAIFMYTHLLGIAVGGVGVYAPVAAACFGSVAVSF